MAEQALGQPRSRGQLALGVKAVEGCAGQPSVDSPSSQLGRQGQGSSCCRAAPHVPLGERAVVEIPELAQARHGGLDLLFPVSAPAELAADLRARMNPPGEQPQAGVEGADDR